MARTDTLTNFLTDVASSIRDKKRTTEEIPASSFDTEIASIETGGNFDINNTSYLFYDGARIELYDKLYDCIKDVTDCHYMFYNSSKTQVNKLDKPVDLSTGQLDSLTNTNSYVAMFQSSVNIPEIKISSTSNKPVSTNYMFANCDNLKTLDVSGLNTENVTSMQYMFQNCCNLTEIPLGFLQFNTNKTTNIVALFSGCNNIKELDLSAMQFLNITSLEGIFSGCNNATIIKLPSTSTKVTSINNCFGSCDNLKELDLNNLNFSTITNVNYLFQGTVPTTDNNYQDIEGTLEVDFGDNKFTKVTDNISNFLYNNHCIRKINLSCIENAKITSFSSFFTGATSLVEIDLSVLNPASRPTSLQSMFRDCVRLKTIKGLETITTNFTSNNSGNICKMFQNCKALTSVDLSNIDASKLINGSSYSSTAYYYGFDLMFENCESLPQIDISMWTINSSLNKLLAMFRNCKSATTISLPDFSQTGINDTRWLFSGCTNLKTINNINKLPFNKITNFTEMFKDCASLEEFTMPNMGDIGTTRNYTTSGMFQGCTSLTNFDGSSMIPNSNTSNTANNSMWYMFDGCTNLETVDMSNWYSNSYNTSLASYMFNNCSSLKTIKFPHDPNKHVFGTKRYFTPPAYTFYGCSSLETLDLRYCMSGDSQTSYGNYTFGECRKLRKLDLRGTHIGELNSGSSDWASGAKTHAFYNCGVDLPDGQKTIVYVSKPAYVQPIIDVANVDGLGWTRDNVIAIENPEEEVDMS